MRRTTVWAIATTLFFAAGLSAQGKPDFSGKWTSTAPPGGGRPGGGGAARVGGFCGQECTIAQDAATLTVTRTRQAGEEKLTYKLDGSESKNAAGGAPGVELVDRAMWDGAKLVIRPMGFRRDGVPALGGDGTVGTITVSMNGGQMEVEMSPTATARGTGGSEIGSKQTYKKN